MISLKLFHALHKGIHAFHGLRVVATCAEATYRAVSLDAYHALRHYEVEEWLLQVLVLVVHHETDVHQRAVLGVDRPTEQAVAVNLSIQHFCTLMSATIHLFHATLFFHPTRGLEQ